MGWIRIRYVTDAATGARLADLLEDLGSVAVTTEGREDLYDEPGARQGAWRRVAVTGLFPGDRPTASIVEAVSRQLGGAAPEPVLDALPEQDWERAWMDRYRPVHAGGRLWICPSWCPPPEPDAVNVILDPGLAFGSGTHPTTLACLRWLAGHPPQDLEVVDYGCGSGILAISALKLGARRARAVDIDPQALAATAANARRNAVAHRLAVLTPGEFKGDAVPAPLVMANILAGPLLALQPVLTAAVAPGGVLLLSGILADQADALARAYGTAFECRRTAAGDWALLELRRRPG